MLGADVGVRPVQVRLLGREQVEVPLAGRTRLVLGARPGRSSENRLPAVRRQFPVAPVARSEPEARPLGRAGRSSEGVAEPRVLIGDVVRDDVDDRADPERARRGNELLRLVQRPVGGVDRAVVRDVVAVVGHRRRVPGVEPDGVDAELAQVGQPVENPRQVADPVAVPVGEAADVDLVDDGLAPPLGIRRDRAFARRGRFQLAHAAPHFHI